MSDDRPAPLAVVLHRPLIPNNTGNIGRTCVVVGAELHLIHPLGFDLSEKKRRRAGLDYWPRLRLREHADWASYVRATGPVRRWFFCAGRGRCAFEADLRRGDHLVFGSETVGLPEQITSDWPDRVLSLPMAPGERSLNLADAVCAAIYEALRQMLARGELRLGPGVRLLDPARTDNRVGTE